MCGYGGAHINQRLDESADSTLFLLTSQKQSVGGPDRQIQLLNRIHRYGESPFLYPIPDEVGDYIHMYWSNEFKAYLLKAKNAVEENLSNWSFYHSERDMPEQVKLSYNNYVIDPVYHYLHYFISREDYTYFFLTEDLIQQLVKEALIGNISKEDSVSYIIQVLRAYPLGTIPTLLEALQDNVVNHELASWIRNQKLDSQEKMVSADMFASSLYRVFLTRLMLLRLYPQKDVTSYREEIIHSLTTTKYSPNLPKQLLVTRLRDQDYYRRLSKEVTTPISPQGEMIKQNVRLFMRDLELYTIPFAYDGDDTVGKPIPFKDARGDTVYRIVYGKDNTIIHSVASNLFIPPPPMTDTAIQQLQQTEQRLLQSLSGKHRAAAVAERMSQFNRAAALHNIFLPTRSELILQLEDKESCHRVVASACTAERKRKRQTIKSAKSFRQLLRLFVNEVNAANRDELLRLYAEAYPLLTEKPRLPAYTTAFGDQVTDFMVEKRLGPQIKKQLNGVWNGIQAKLIIDEHLTPVYTILSLMLSPQFKTFLTPDQQQLAEAAWSGLESTAHQFAASHDACHVSVTAMNREQIRCVLENSASLLRMTHQQLQKYHKTDITK